jgi:hypothetical protein
MQKTLHWFKVIFISLFNFSSVLHTDTVISQLTDAVKATGCKVRVHRCPRTEIDILGAELNSVLG